MTTPITYTWHPSLEPFAVSGKDYKLAHPNPLGIAVSGYSTGIVVFEPASSADNAKPTAVDGSNSSNGSPNTLAAPRILLLKRALTDSMPSLWETPGGGIDDEDATVLSAAVRELQEEAGLGVARILAIVPVRPDVDSPGYVFPNRRGNRHYCKLTFAVEPENIGAAAAAADDHDGVDDKGNNGLEVKINPQEHSEYRWVTEDEIRNGEWADGSDKFDLTSKYQETVLLETFRLKREGKLEG